MKTTLLSLALTGTVLANAPAAPIQFKSGEKQVSLVELYTSEGCSSCPPAESWLARLKDSPALWKGFAPLAFHVDYWNSLGWKDRWSSPEFWVTRAGQLEPLQATGGWLTSPGDTNQSRR